jgi:hypothetical protein
MKTTRLQKKPPGFLSALDDDSEAEAKPQETGFRPERRLSKISIQPEDPALSDDQSEQ